MSAKVMDDVYDRWLGSPSFRALMDRDPDAALAGYDLTDHERNRMANVLSRKRRRAAYGNAQRVRWALRMPLPSQLRPRFYRN